MIKKSLLILLFVFTLLKADDNYELKLFESVIPTIFKVTPLVVYLDKEMSTLLKDSKRFKVVKECSDSVTLLIGREFSNLPKSCQTKPLFATRYRVFKKNPNSFGSFYWRKGRPQIKFKKSVLNRYDLTLPHNLKRYEQ